MLTDDLDARRIASDEGVEVHGSVGVILLAYNLGERSETGARQAHRNLERDTNLYLSAPLIEHALDLVDSDEAGW